MIDILSASAGSGKTFALAKTYIGLLFNSEDRYAYRHILAVTFTNKATAEMKTRILKELHTLAVSPEKSAYYADFVPSIFKTGSELSARSSEVLSDILHDYSAFSISTIDKFFQQTLRAFSREIGQMASYQVELDRNSLIAEAMDRILDSLSEEQTDLLEWFRRSVSQQLESGRKVSLDEGLYDMGRKLKNQEHARLAEQYGIEQSSEFDKEKLDAITEGCGGIITKFHEQVRQAALELRPSLKKAKSLEKIELYAAGFGPADRVVKPIKTLMDEAAGSSFETLFGTPFKVYNTARILSDQVLSLGLAGEFYRSFDALMKEKNVLCLDESNTILRDIIDGSDAPFVYEKLGVRFENFLLDEFQDTSNIQWVNFRPLLKESDANNRKSLIVGDVKQSIYRWRDSDWKLLAREVPSEFPQTQPRSLTDNWRSLPGVVEFNNRFFEFASEKLGLRSIYSDVSQTARRHESQNGRVDVSFTDDVMSEVLLSVQSARERGARWNDIAILVRNGKDGASIASSLVEQGIPVVSDDTLEVKASIVVRRLASLLSCIDNPDDSVNSFLSSSMNIELPVCYHSLVDLAEGLLRGVRDFDPASFAGETLYIQAFMDNLREWTSVNGNSLRAFLRHWNESSECISSPSVKDAVMILTIHKSKGLEYPYVIFPYADKVSLFHDGSHWCHLDTDGTAFPTSIAGLYPVDISAKTADTLFSADLEKERRMQVVDNMNVFYVALTRASKCLSIIAKTPTASFRKALDAGRADYGRMTDLLYEFCGKNTKWFSGVPYDFSLMDRKVSDAGEIAMCGEYASFPINAEGETPRLTASEDALDFFSEEGVGASGSARLSGIALHHILSKVVVPSDLEKAVREEVDSCALTEDEGVAAYALLSARIESASFRGWFPSESDAEVSNELSLFAANGEVSRPDRVVCTPDRTIVVDYKFGTPKPSYEYQVRRYMALCRALGMPDVKGYLWYVKEDEVQEITLNR